MKEIIYKNRLSPKYKRRVITIHEWSACEGYQTHTQKAFIYIVEEKKSIRDPLPAPEFFITKITDSLTREEKFHFRVKGLFWVVKNKHFLEVQFCHSLRIDMVPKS
ncbi:MAG: hypothetical protein ABIJ41_04865 [Candidatus Omnitrophota bacterium]